MEQQLNRRTRRILGRYSDVIFDKLSKEDLIDALTKALENLEPNLILLSDAYKYSHHKFYVQGLTKLTSYLESRGGKFNEIVMFGRQYIIKKYLVGQVLSEEMIEEAFDDLNGDGGVFGVNGPFSKQKWLDLLRKHNGYLPIEIRGVAEGEVITVKNVLTTITNTDDEFPWLTNFIESLFLQVWYPITVATLSREVKKIIKKYLLLTGTKLENIEPMIQFILNDFGFRGSSSVESAGIGGASHLVNFMGSDNIEGSKLLKKYYGAKMMYGKSISATEHSIMTLKGKKGELEILRNVLLDNPEGLIACVMDSYDVFHAVAKYCGEDLKDIIMSRKGTFVIRLDSGDAPMTIKTVLEILFEKFGYTTNELGFRLLPDQIRVLQSDGVNYDSIIQIYDMMLNNNMSAECLVLGMGGKLLQAQIDRDVQNFAIKACHAIIDGKEYDVIKSPVEMDKNGEIHTSFKKSKAGNMKLVKTNDGGYYTITSSEEGFNEAKDELITIFKDGVLLVDYSIEEIRERAKL